MLHFVPDRKEAVTQESLCKAFSQTAELWMVRNKFTRVLRVIIVCQDRFGVPYTTSGHLLASTDWQKNPFALSPVKGKAISSKQGANDINYEAPLVYSRIDSLLSHPCERNAITLLHDNGKWEKIRMTQLCEGQKKAEDWVKKGKMDREFFDRHQQAPIAFFPECPVYDHLSAQGYPCSSNGFIITANARATPASVCWSLFSLAPNLIFSAWYTHCLLTCGQMRARWLIRDVRV